MKKYLPFIILSVIMLVSALNTIQAQEYVGDDRCKMCHNNVNDDLGYNIYEEYAKTGHPYKLNKIDGGHPYYPENTTPGVVLPNGKTWDDFSYVIGGYGWKARFIDHNGKIFTGDEASDSTAQYNLENETWVDYHKGEDKAYNFGCFTCHSTGPSEEGSWNENTEGLGTFAQPGIRCEACHGPGSEHASSPSSVKPPNEGDYLKMERCGECHQRGGTTNAIPASGGYIKHHEQINEMRASKHGNMFTCATCHDTHISLTYAENAGEGLSGIKKDCSECHSDKSIEIIEDGVTREKDLSCTSCHMSPAAKSAVGMQMGNGWRGDIPSHIMAINSDPVTREAMFDEAGTLVALDDDGLAAVTLDYACLGCHTNEDVVWASSYAIGIHENGIVVGVEEDGTLPQEYALKQNYPNPFNPTTNIDFSLPNSSNVKLNVYSITGQLVAELVNNMMPAGYHNVQFDASQLASGIYLYAISADDFSFSKKMILMK